MEWIDVNKELPKENENVLIHGKSFGWKIGCFENGVFKSFFRDKTLDVNFWKKKYFEPPKTNNRFINFGLMAQHINDTDMQDLYLSYINYFFDDDEAKSFVINNPLKFCLKTGLYKNC